MRLLPSGPGFWKCDPGLQRVESREMAGFGCAEALSIRAPAPLPWASKGCESGEVGPSC